MNETSDLVIDSVNQYRQCGWHTFFPIICGAIHTRSTDANLKSNIDFMFFLLKFNKWIRLPKNLTWIINELECEKNESSNPGLAADNKKNHKQEMESKRKKSNFEWTNKNERHHPWKYRKIVCGSWNTCLCDTWYRRSALLRWQPRHWNNKSIRLTTPWYSCCTARRTKKKIMLE